ncbi:MAG: GTP-binding protein [Bacteroidales bacterium]|nr:GTP-binding protein [Bacteroidales bacterium]
MKQTPILLLTGYLGSGKTTLVNRILANRKGIKFAVIVNDIGEVNIDASLIAKGGVVGSKDDSLVALQNGCICCTLKMDLVEQISSLVEQQTFDYIVIEASGICEPVPIAQTICSIPSLGPQYNRGGSCYLDCIVSVVDALRLKDEFECGGALQRDNIEEDDIENLLIQQIEFCNIILLNKASDLTPTELGRVKAIVRAIQPTAQIIECDYADVDLDKLLSTRSFDFEKAATSAAWVRELEGGEEEELENEEEGESEEYNIGTFVYYRRLPFDMNRFDYFIAHNFTSNIIRVKGVCWFKDDYDMSYLFESAGREKKLSEAGYWYATAPEEDLKRIAEQDPNFLRDWDSKVGDRMQKLVFIGQNLDKEKITKDLDFCLVVN